MLQEDYRVSLDSFQGPLDLLLFLIRRAEVDIADIPLAAITDQYLAFLSRVDEIDVEMAGEFLVMAATLIELKSRTIAPPPEAGEGDTSGDDDDATSALNPSDPRYDLVQQLLAYQRYRIAAEDLDLRRLEFEQRAVLRPGRRPDDGEPQPELELEDVHVMDLAEAYERIVASIDFTRLGEHVVEMDDTPIALYQEDLIDQLTRTGGHRITLQRVFHDQTPPRRVGFFLATLELTRQRRVSIVQEQIDGEIEVTLRDEVDGVPNDESAASSATPAAADVVE